MTHLKLILQAVMKTLFSNQLVITKLTEPAEQQGVMLHTVQALNLAVANGIKNVTFKTS